MSENSKTARVVVIVAALSAFAALAAYAIGAYNTAAKTEVSLKAARDNNQNVLAQGQQKVLEAAQVPEMMREDFLKVARESIAARYGASGSQATFQWLQEHNPELDSKAYIKIQQLIEAYRSEFQTAQTRMIDQRRGYESHLASFPNNVVLSLMGFPRVDLAEYAPIITDAVEQTFKAGKEASPLKIRQ